MSRLAIRQSPDRLPPGVVIVDTLRRLSDGANMWVVEITPVDPVAERTRKKIHTAYNVGQMQANFVDLHG